MRNLITKWTVAGLVGLLAACAVITVNVYFPEKDVKQAYKSLDDMLLQTNKTPETKDEKQPVDTPKEPEKKPVSMLPMALPAVSLISKAYAQDELGNKLAGELSGIPEVQKAYEEMRARLPQMNTLRDSGAIGEAADGSVVVRDPSKAGNAGAVVQAENNNRKTVITNMARAILRINKQPENKNTMKQVIGKAAATFAETKRDQAKAGWWIQLGNGRWVQK
jgi:hypothetical protein